MNRGKGFWDSLGAQSVRRQSNVKREIRMSFLDLANTGIPLFSRRMSNLPSSLLAAIVAFVAWIGYL